MIQYQVVFQGLGFFVGFFKFGRGEGDLKETLLFCNIVRLKILLENCVNYILSSRPQSEHCICTPLRSMKCWKPCLSRSIIKAPFTTPETSWYWGILTRAKSISKWSQVKGNMFVQDNMGVLAGDVSKNKNPHSTAYEDSTEKIS